MKTDIHPKYQQITFTCACGAKFIAGSTIEKDFKTEICSACHPFYTGKQKLVDSSGRIDKFMAKMRKAQEKAEKNVEKVEKGKTKEVTKETTIKKVDEEKPEKADEEKPEKAEKKPAKKEKK